MKYYTVYDNHTEEVVAFGGSMPCAAALGMSVESFYCLVSRGGSKKYSIVSEENKPDVK